MDLVKYLILFSLFTSCAKTSYLVEQGLGQMSLLSKAEWNDKLLKDKKVKKKHKDKIRKIEAYKKWFYEFWGREETKIYSKTTFLEGKAVTWLVISSPFDEVKAHEECFPIMGCFPYLGFFKKKSAMNYIEERKEGGAYTYIRPVYAYSTLGYFTDTILSSFFYYEDFDLSELIFHELFHTIFFAKDEVELNENLANYFGKELALVHFKMNDHEIEKFRSKRKRNSHLNQVVAKLALDYNSLLKQSKPANKSESDKILSEFLNNTFNKNVLETCLKLKIEEKNCYPLKNKWNNASFAAYLTYEKKMNKVERLRELKKLDLKAFFNYIQERYKEFEKTSKEGDFSAFLFDELENKNAK
ncbi:MAG: aminopeptidase [Bacteriovoracaceae bacterium]|nr:aminopeptidase [Bacteriovoracaceae bacterium]